MTFRKGCRFAWFEIAPTPMHVHCVRQQCFRQRKCASVSKRLITNAAPIRRWSRQQTPRMSESQPVDAVLMDEWRRPSLSHTTTRRWVAMTVTCEGSGTWNAFAWKWASLVVETEGFMNPPKTLPSPVTLFHFLSLFSLSSSSSLPFPAGGAELALTVLKENCNHCDEVGSSHLSTFTDGFLTLQSK